MDWYCAVTSAPRIQPTVKSTVDSLRRARFMPHVFAEPGTDFKHPGAVVFENNRRLGVWHNWIQAAQAAIDTKADLCLIVQDDINIHPSTRVTLEMLFSGREVISVYTPRAYSHRNFTIMGPRLDPGIYRVRSKKLWGVVGVAYSRHILEAIVNHPIIEQWRGVQPALRNEDIVNSDVAIGQILYSMHVPIWFPTPSFGVHTSQYSTIPGHGSNDVERNRNAELPADFSKPLWHQLFPSSGEMAPSERR